MDDFEKILLGERRRRLEEAENETGEIEKQIEELEEELSEEIEIPKALDYSDLTIDELNQRLGDAIAKENYEEASKIKAEIDKRNAN